MGSKSNWRDNVLVEQLWRSIKYEGADLKAHLISGNGQTIDQQLDPFLPSEAA